MLGGFRSFEGEFLIATRSSAAFRKSQQLRTQAPALKFRIHTQLVDAGNCPPVVPGTLRLEIGVVKRDRPYEAPVTDRDVTCAFFDPLAGHRHRLIDAGAIQTLPPQARERTVKHRRELTQGITVTQGAQRY
jgi:hypothetical protein